MSSEKVVIPKDVAEAIEKLREVVSDFEIVAIAVKGTVTNYMRYECEAVCKYAEDYADTLLQALVNGYEIEATPEDRIREYYRGHEPHALLDTPEKFHVNLGRRGGVRKTLNILGITIEGVND